MKRTPKESAILVEKVIKKINALAVNAVGVEKREIISNVCKKYGVSENHILNVGGFFFLKEADEIIRNNGTNS